MFSYHKPIYFTTSLPVFLLIYVNGTWRCERGINIWTGPVPVNWVLHTWTGPSLVNRTSTCEPVLHLWTDPLCVKRSSTRPLCMNVSSTCERVREEWTESPHVKWRPPPVNGTCICGRFLQVGMVNSICKRDQHWWTGPPHVVFQMWTRPQRMNGIVMSEQILNVWTGSSHVGGSSKSVRNLRCERTCTRTWKCEQVIQVSTRPPRVNGSSMREQILMVWTGSLCVNESSTYERDLCVWTGPVCV